MTLEGHRYGLHSLIMSSLLLRFTINALVVSLGSVKGSAQRVLVHLCAIIHEEQPRAYPENERGPVLLRTGCIYRI